MEIQSDKVRAVLDRMKTRIVSVQGPFNLLSVLAHLFGERGGGTASYQDILVVHGTFAGDDLSCIHAVIRDLAQVWTWERVVFLEEFEKLWGARGGKLDAESFSAVRHAVGLERVDEIMVVRNWQSTNELLLKAYPTARKILFGDAFGQMDSYAGPRFERMDEGRFLLPVRYFPYSHEETVIAADALPYSVTPKRFVLDVIEKYLHCSPQAREVHRDLGIGAEKKVILLTKNATESRVAALETEIGIYVDAVRAVAKPGIEVIIKPHPRESLGQSRLVQRALREIHNIECRVVGAGTYLGHMPVEILCAGNNFHAVLAPLVSVTCRQLKYLYGIDSYEPLSDEMLARINPARAYHYLATDLVNRETVQGLDTWNGRDYIYEWNAAGTAEKAQLARLGAVSSGWPEFRQIEDPTLSAALHELALFSGSGEPGRLYQVARKIIRLAPQDFSLLVSLGDLVAQAGDLESALRAFEIATIVDPKATLAHAKYSNVLKERGATARASIAHFCAENSPH